ncbi:molybdenum cofactor biosynthesis protein MoaE [Halobacteriovorax sp. HLS]|uniref:molybdenum cofactor biosynthesis protein MoaE n=1 Tax=Halobacteriovorax sp. HLS TaxID=2234000 RepID=UPI000FD9C768|nr:molybdenum cofactor biosynthesis protein MoaE [Halobacteriovorax sp. HLS]
MFEMTSRKITHDELISKVEDDKAGAIVFFDGRVRNHNEGHKVSSLEYQSYEAMAIKEGQKIIDEAKELFDFHHAYCVHRVGHLQIGDVAVWVAVSTSHRELAFKACQFIIDEVKARVPIWKKEHYIDKSPEWVACHQCAKHSHGSETHSHHHMEA